MSQDLLSPDEFGQMLDDPEFAKLPFDTRKTYVEKGIAEASRFIAERAGGWTPEKWRQFGAAAQQARQFVSESETLGETAMRYAGVAGQTIKDLPAIIGTGVVGLSPVLPDGQGGVTGQVPGETLGPALGRNIVGLAASGAAMLSDAEQPLVQKLGALKQQIDQGDFLAHQQGFGGWIDEQNQAVRDTQKQFYGNADWADQNSLLGNEENVKLMQSYLTTRSPQAWEALQANLLRTPFRAKLQADKQALENDTTLGRALAPEARPLISEAADPAELLPGMLAVKKGVQIATKGASAGSRALDAAKGIAGEMLGEQVSATIDNPYLSAAERLQIAKDSLAGSLGLMGVGAGAKAAVQALSPSTINPEPSTNDSPPPNQTPAPTGAPQTPGATPGAAPLAGAAGPLPSTLSRIAQESLVPDLPEDTGELTAEEVADLEGQQGQEVNGQELSRQPSRVPAFADDPLRAPMTESGDVINDLRIPRSPEAIAESQRLENERQSQIARLRMIDNKAQGMPVIPDSPRGDKDILDFANENPIYLPPGFSKQRNLPEYEKLKGAKLPQYWRQFIASSKRGGNPGDVAQRAFDQGFIAEPTADAYFNALNEGIDGRKQYRAQFATREKALATEEKQVVAFDKSQTKLAKQPDAQEVPFEDVLPGDQMTIDGEQAVVKNVEFNEDGYLTNVVIEDGKRFGLMQFDPQSRGGILVDEYQPRAARNQTASNDFAPELQPPATSPFESLLQGTESTRPLNVGETAKAQNADPLGELMGAKQAGEAERAQGKMSLSRSTAPPAQTDAQPVVPELLTPAQLQSYGQAQDIANAQARLDAAMAAQDRGAAELAMMTLTGAKAGSGPLATRAVRAQDEAVTLAILSARPVNAVAMERWAQYPATSAIGPDGNIPRRGIPAEYAKQGDVYVHSQAAQAQDNAGKTQGGGFKNLNVSGRTAGFLNTDILNEAIDLLRSGITDFANWSRAMVTRFGRAIQEFLAGIWQQVTSPQTNAAQNVRMGRAQGTAPVTLGNSGAVLNPAAAPSRAAAAPNETQSRFASPNEAARVINGPRTDAMVADQARRWLDSVDTQTAVEQFVAQAVPLPLDAAEHAAAVLISRLTSESTTNGTEVQRLWAHVQSQRMARVWTREFLSADPARALRQRGVVNNTILQPIAPVMAAQGILVDRADAVMDKRFEGGGTGAVEKVTKIVEKVDAQTGTDVAADLDADTEGSAGTPARPNSRKGAVKAKHPNLKKLLDALRKKMLPGMTWSDIFMDLPSTQKERQRQIYARLLKDERLRNLNADERLALTNELDKAWQRERRKVFNRELEKAGVLGEKDKTDRVKVQKALPKLLRMINLGMFNSEMWREAVAPEYGLRMLTAADTAQLRTLAEAAWKLPEGVIRNQKLRDLLNAIQKKTGASWIEVLNSYWTAAVLSGLRTQFDTWLAAINGMGTNLMQIGGLMARGQGRAAIDAHAQWWRGLFEGVRESGQILFKGDTSYLKRFGADLKKALEGETSVTPVPMGENLWRDPDAKTAAGRAFQKYGLAPVMMFTGRLMAAADHINNTATTQGAIAVARALHPELYQGRVGFTASERADARTQALREVTGGAAPKTSQERATVSARTREILNGTVKPADYAAASEIGDMAAYQNDPTGVFGIIYSAMKQGLGSIQRGLGDYAQDVTANRFARVISGVMAGSLHGITGTRFMRFGANFGADLTRYIPGSYLGKAGFYGRDVSRMQQELLLGKNLVGLMLASTLAAIFLNSDDEDEGWQIEGDWSTLNPQQAKERMAAGYERLTMWKREGGKVRRVSYKQWPTMGLFAVVGGMLDEKRHKPASWAERGAAGHLLRGVVTGYTQVMNVSAVRNLVELFGEPSFSSDKVTSTIDQMIKTGTNFAGGFMPTLVKDAEAWTDPRNFKPEGAAELMLRSMPIARKFVNDGRPQLNLLGEEVKLQRAPWSRAYTSVESGEAHRVLGALLARGLALPMPSDEVTVIKDNVRVPLETLGRDAVWRYEKAVGQGYKDWLSLEGSDLLKLPVQDADARIKARSAAIKARAKASVVK